MSDLKTNPSATLRTGVLYYGADAAVILSEAKNLAEPRGICHV
ncbi:MAG: hypothetical protein Q7R32_11165 [Dehalococcoidia bacterium]|nr:hypothetical protein [Dehalococcoidia bacterium]